MEFHEFIALSVAVLMISALMAFGYYKGYTAAERDNSR
jgi:hypothetical protein